MLKNPLYVYGDQNYVKVPAHMNYGQHVLEKFRGYGDSAAILDAENGETLNYKQLVDMIIDIALSLVRMGVRKGQVVSVCSEKRMEFIPTVLGAICAGATFAPADITCGRATILHRINLARPAVMFCSPSAYEIHKETLRSVESIEKMIIFGDECADNAISFKEFITEHGDNEDFLPVEVNGWEDLAVILYSSGTTGLQKGVKLSHLNFLLFLTDPGAKGDSISKGLKTLITREWYHSYGLGHTLFTLYEGSTVVYCPGGEVKNFLEAVEKYKIDVMQLAPTTVSEMVKSTTLSQYDVSSLTLLVSTSTPFSAEMAVAAKSKFPNLQAATQYYGLSEAGCVCSDRWAPNDPKPGSVGCVLPSFVIKVVDLDTREPLGPNRRGEICFKSSSLMLGYIGGESLDYLDEEGFFKTGDIGYYDDDKYFYIVDRIKELIKFNSYQVAPAELEAVLEQHPLVASAGVAGAPHPQYGEVPTAFVVLRPGDAITADELVKYVDGEVSHRMRLAGGVRFVDSLPLVPSGKLDRKVLRKILTDSN